VGTLRRVGDEGDLPALGEGVRGPPDADVGEEEGRFLAAPVHVIEECARAIPGDEHLVE